jgi:hypothetical protein
MNKLNQSKTREKNDIDQKISLMSKIRHPSHTHIYIYIYIFSFEHVLMALKYNIEDTLLCEQVGSHCSIFFFISVSICARTLSIDLIVK